MEHRPTNIRAVSLRRWLAVAVAVSELAASASLSRGEERAPGGIGLIAHMREQILAHLKLHPGMVVAEIGVGPGWFVVKVSEAVGSNGVVYGTDIDPGAIEKLRQRVPKLPPASGRVELRLCRDERDTALEDLADGHVDIILMVDSLCFDAQKPREQNVAYLQRFLRILRPGGRLAHHMDCRCDVSPNDVVALFRDAGFSEAEIVDVGPDPALIDASWPCRSDTERQRHAFLGIFRKPDSRPDTRG